MIGVVLNATMSPLGPSMTLADMNQPARPPPREYAEMPLKIYREKDLNLAVFRNATVAVIGYGNQGRAHALNLRDSLVKVVVGQRPGRSYERAREDGFDPCPVGEAVAVADVVVMTLPDETAAAVFQTDVAPNLRRGQALGFVHGFNLRYGFVDPAPIVDVIMIAPKGPGALLRSLYLEGKGLPALLAVHRDVTGNARRVALAWAAGIGCTRAGVVESTVAAETETDLFGEQVVLCGGMSALVKAAFETLVDAGYEPEFAYLECAHELKQVVDLMYARGLSGMRDCISNTAEYGDLTRGPRLVNAGTRQEMKRILEEIRNGDFAREWMDEHRGGGQRFKQLHEADVDTAFEHAGRSVRALMPWLAGEPV